jgi:DNA polymerase-1
VKRGKPRELFVASPGNTLLVLDYAQVEPRVLAHLSQDPYLLSVFHSDEDFYSALAKIVLNLSEAANEIKTKYKHIRSCFKTIGLSIIYGIGAKKLARYLTNGLGEKYTYTQASKIRDDLLNKLVGVKRYREIINNFHFKHKYIENLLGRRLYLPESELFHKGINTVVQSSASDMACEGQLRLDKALTEANIPHKLILMVHDEAVNEIPLGYENQVGEIAQKACSDSFELSVKFPIEMFFGQNWGCK